MDTDLSQRGCGGLLVGLSWIMNSQVSTLPMLYLAQAIGGIGAGAVYGTCVGNALKWFPDHRGLAAGLTGGVTAGAGSILPPYRGWYYLTFIGPLP